MFCKLTLFGLGFFVPDPGAEKGGEFSLFLRKFLSHDNETSQVDSTSILIFLEVLKG